MEKKIIFKQLLLHYSDKMAYAILQGKRKPSYEVMVELDSNLYNRVPFTAWKDIKSFISNSNNSSKNDNTTRV